MPVSLSALQEPPLDRTNEPAARKNGRENGFGWIGRSLESNFKRFVEVGRVVLLKAGPSAGKIAVIAEIIDHNRAIIDGPTTSVPRQAYPYKHLALTPLKLTGLPRAAGTGAVRKLAEKEALAEKWEKSAWAQKRAAMEKRRSLNDFGRFSVMLAKKQRRDVVRKAIHKAKKA
ncbi:60S ribosomal protein L14-A [Termitomyces sp. J132]|nr:hypothetical protein H2248_011220 [Termitomyces sp. 'cryptogamus']KNZ73710.1 60S ribosomal protein L14-A [Termitomyces sp. J132]